MKVEVKMVVKVEIVVEVRQGDGGSGDDEKGGGWT